METSTLNTPEEIALWTAAACAQVAAGGLPSASDAAGFADRLLLEFRARLSAPAQIDAPASATPDSLRRELRKAMEAGSRVRVAFANGDVSEGLVLRPVGGDCWELDTDEHFGVDSWFDDSERAISVSICAAPDLNEQLRLAAERKQRVRATMADGSVICAIPMWCPDQEGDSLPALLDENPADEEAVIAWCGQHANSLDRRVVKVELLA